MSYVYFIRATDNGTIKIGTARDVQRRLWSLRVSSPSPLVLLAAMKGTHRTERALHRQFAHLQVHNEWFRAEPELLAYVENTKENGIDVTTLLPERPPRTHCKHGHELIESNLTVSGQCRECSRFRCREHYAKLQKAYRSTVDTNDPNILAWRQGTHCIHGHGLTEDNRAADGKCRTCVNKRSLEYQRRRRENRTTEWQGNFPELQGMCRAGLHKFEGENIAIDSKGGRYCRPCLNDYNKRRLDTGDNRETHNRSRRERRDSKTGKYATHCKNGHELSGDNLKVTTKQRVCRTCDNIRGATYRERKRSGSLSKAVS